MKRQELKNLLQGVENAGEIIDRIMEINGEDIENAKKNAGTDYEAVVAERDKWKAEAESYGKGGAKYVDPAEIERLKKFETDTKTAQKRATVEAAVNEMLTRNKVNSTFIKLMLKNLNTDEVKLDDKGKVTTEYETEYMKAFKADYPEAIETPRPGTGAPSRSGSGEQGGGGSGATDGFEDLRKLK